MVAQLYPIIQTAILIILSVACMLLTLSIFRILHGGSLGTPWIFIVGGFALGALYGIIYFLDSLKIMFHQYDLRLFYLFLSSFAMILILTGFWLYKRGLR